MGHVVKVVTPARPQRKAMESADALISTAFVPGTRSDVLAAFQLTFIQVTGVGADRIALKSMQERGILVDVVAGANAESVVEHVIMAALALLRSLVPSQLALVQGKWDLPRWMAQAQDLLRKTFGIYGIGRIGQELAQRLIAFEVTLLHEDQIPFSSADQEQLWGLSFVSTVQPMGCWGELRPRQTRPESHMLVRSRGCWLLLAMGLRFTESHHFGRSPNTACLWSS